MFILSVLPHFQNAADNVMESDYVFVLKTTHLADLDALAKDRMTRRSCVTTSTSTSSMELVSWNLSTMS